MHLNKILSMTTVSCTSKINNKNSCVTKLTFNYQDRGVKSMPMMAPFQMRRATSTPDGSLVSKMCLFRRKSCLETVYSVRLLVWKVLIPTDGVICRDKYHWGMRRAYYKQSWQSSYIFRTAIVLSIGRWLKLILLMYPKSSRGAL